MLGAGMTEGKKGNNVVDQKPEFHLCWTEKGLPRNDWRSECGVEDQPTGIQNNMIMSAKSCRVTIQSGKDRHLNCSDDHN